MAAEPSIKGSLFIRAVEDVLKLISSGALARGELGRWLQPSDVGLLEQPVTPSGWYVVRAIAMVFDRYLQGHADRERFSRIV